jgi:hypothetical protein
MKAVACGGGEREGCSESWKYLPSHTYSLHRHDAYEHVQLMCRLRSPLPLFKLQGLLPTSHHIPTSFTAAQCYLRLCQERRHGNCLLITARKWVHREWGHTVLLRLIGSGVLSCRGPQDGAVCRTEASSSPEAEGVQAMALCSVVVLLRACAFVPGTVSR